MPHRLLWLAILAAMGGGTAHGAARFVDAPCAFTVPAGASIRCGWVTVPENRQLAAGREIRLHVAVYKSASAHPATDPIVWLVGGPGGRAHATASILFDRVVKPFLGRRDFIVFDVRGTGYSEPALSCPEGSGDPAQWLTACRDRLSVRADLTCYNSAAVAADLADLRTALGYKEWNLLGESYGTRLALTAMRDHPEGIRSVVLDSVSPPETDDYADGPAKFDSALSALFSGCAANPSCNRRYPDLRSAVLRAADRLDVSPRRLAGVWHGTSYEFRLDGRQLLEALRMALYESDLIPDLPKAIYGAADGIADSLWSEVIARHTLFVFRRLVDNGAHLCFHCREEVPFTDRARMLAEDRSRPWMRHAAAALSIVDACRVWLPQPADPREALPVTSRIPTLLLAGEYDPATPPTYARSAASHLAYGQLFVFPGMGHWLTANTANACPQSLALEFLDRPDRRPSGTCAQRLDVRWTLE